MQNTAYYIDIADQHLGRANGERDPARAANHIAAAQVNTQAAIATALSELAQAIADRS
jgi:hypothetical protein